MGAWGAGNFENDTALDWVWELERSSDLSTVENAISDVLNQGEYLDADTGCIGLAAAEVVAALRHKPLDRLPDEVSAWVRTHSLNPSDALVNDSLAAVAKIRNDDSSELKELWEEDETILAEWHSVLDDLIARLQ
jgi:hypothetical protein